VNGRRRFHACTPPPLDPGAQRDQHEADHEQPALDEEKDDADRAPNQSDVPGQRGYFFFIAERYMTSASTSSLGNVKAFISGLRVAVVFAVIPFASVIHARMSLADSLLPISSSGPFELPFPPTEWHSAHP
jgi:hypothetical protein